MNVQNGSVTFERVRRPADFESKRASVTLSFAIDTPDDLPVVLEAVGNMAQGEALRLVGEIVAPRTAAQPLKAQEVRPTPVVEPAAVSAPLAGAPAADVSPVKQPTDDEIRKAIDAKRVSGISGDDIKKVIASHVSQIGASYKTIAADDPARTNLLTEINALGAAPTTGDEY